ncbi:MAG: S8 family serine peptidase [Anaerolineae bacterium]
MLTIVRRYTFAIALLFALTLLSGSAAQASQPAQGKSAAPIKLRAVQFTPAYGEAPKIPPGLAVSEYAQGQRGYYIVQFAGPVEQEWKDEVAAAGADILDYIPDFAFKVRMNPAQARQVAALSNVAWVGLFHPAYKLSPDLVRNGTRLYTVQVEQGAELGQTIAEVAQSGAAVTRPGGDILMVAADSAQLDAIAQVLDVAWVENFLLPQKHNEYGAGLIIGTATANANGYDGSTQIAAVADTGLDTGAIPVAHPAFANAVKAIYNWPGVTDSCFQKITDDGAQDVDSGHGTHVAGSILGRGDALGHNKGGAPAAQLVFQATENWVTTSSLCKSLYGYQDGYYLTGLPADLRQLFQQAYNQGARIHSNSWGSAAAGAYTTNSANTDDFIWNHRDMTITFSAGNEGADANNDGIVDSDSMGSPATAKNVISVGASENDRQGNYQCDLSLSYVSQDTAYQNGLTCGNMGGQNQLGTPGQRWGFTTNPIKDDPTAGNKEQMAAFSSRGPADDGRIKPDVVAPGTWILSTYSTMYREGYGGTTNPRDNAYQLDGWGIPVNGFYKYFGGTSMANPIAAGGATVVRDYYQKAKGVSASAALVKATLINTAEDLLDENNDGVNDNRYPIPNVHEGWGRINVATATNGQGLFADQATGLATGASRTYSANVTSSGPLKVTLVWSDYASATAAAKNLVNDLDLKVTAPNGTTVYQGNVFSGGWSQTGGSLDRTNNVENVYVQSAATGAWSIEVKGYNVPNGPQPFALVVTGASTLTETTPPSAPAAPSNLAASAASKSQINLTWKDNASNEDGYSVERSTSSSFTNPTVVKLPANTTSYSSTGLAANTTYYYRVRASNSVGNSGYSNTASAKTLRR